MSDIPRPEHPRPQFMREAWLNLNGPWRFAFDFGLSGLERGWAEDASKIDREILVPFCPESRLSGIAHTDFIPAVWYRRSFRIPEAWAGQRVFLHFGAVDFDSRAWVNGKIVGRHYGGSSSFEYEITDALNAGENTLTVYAQDDIRSGEQPSGKQSTRFASFGCFYTRVTGIWQTVWLEARPASFLESVRVVPDLDGGRLMLSPRFVGAKSGQRFRAILEAGGGEIARAEAPAANGMPLMLGVPNPRAWSPADPFLYDLRFELLEGDGAVDRVRSYAGLRKIAVDGNRILLNNKPIFLRFVLDQGFYPDGVWTAPSDAELKADIERSLAVGFNGARLHQKVFEERFHYWADKLGYLTWGEYADWGRVHSFANVQGLYNQIVEWSNVVRRDWNHPSIIAWTPTNETIVSAKADLERHRRTIQDLADATRALDPTRPVNDSSGYVHVDTDIYTVHDYMQDPAEFRAHYRQGSPDNPGGFRINHPDLDAPYKGQPFIVDEYGGTWWRPGAENDMETKAEDRNTAWGYGKRPVSVEEVYHRIEELTRALTEQPSISGFTYTQLTDVEQEENGIYTYDRKLKFDAARLKKAFGAPAAIEQ